MEVVRLGAVKLSEDTGAPVVQADVPISGSDTPEPVGELDMMQALGVTANPYPSSSDGYAEGLMAPNINGSPGVVAGGRDTRTADIIGQLGKGETCLHSTGPDMDSRVLCKDQAVAIIVGNDMVFSVDRGAGKIIANAFGSIIEIDEGQGIRLSSGPAGITIKDGNVFIYGNVKLGPLSKPGLPILTGTPASPIPATGASAS